MSVVDLALVEKLAKADLYWRSHRRARFIWSRTSNILLALIAVSGALVGGSVLGDIPAATLVLGILTALFSGANAGLQPAEKAAAHRTASADYGHIFRMIQRLYCEREAKGLPMESLLSALGPVDSAFDKLDVESPSVKPRKTEREDSVKRVSFVLTGKAEGADAGAIDTW